MACACLAACRQAASKDAPVKARKPGFARAALVLQEQIQGLKKASVARFDGLAAIKLERNQGAPHGC